jgi:CRP/FNR family cyclic AMP-dependent transcriptional regulator
LVPPIKSAKKKRDFDPKEFLATIGEGRKVVALPKKQTIFTQGEAADAIFYIQQGKVKLTVISKIGKEATLGILSEGDFFGEGGLAGQPLRTGSATAVTDWRTHANRKEGNDACASPATYIVRPVYGIFVGTKHPI